MVKKRNLFITIEGIEGVGKTTAKSYIETLLQERDVNYICTREPGGTELAEQLRQILLHHQGESVSDITELLLMFAGRAQHITHVIKPALDSGQLVLCDRFTDATYAYQGGGRGIDDSKIAALEHLVQDDLRPDVTILLDADPVISLQRVKKRGDLDRIEQEKMDFHQRVRAKYLQLAELFPERYRVVNAAQSIELVQQQLHRIFLTLIVDYS